MARTTVVNIRKSEYDVYIGRSGKGMQSIWGNPFSVKEYGLGVCIEMYRNYILERLDNEPELLLELKKLKGKRLGCFCKPNACHGDVLVSIIEEIFPDNNVDNDLIQW